jgi:hypothetical protein
VSGKGRDARGGEADGRMVRVRSNDVGGGGISPAPTKWRSNSQVNNIYVCCVQQLVLGGGGGVQSCYRFCRCREVEQPREVCLPFKHRGGGAELS